MIQINLTNDQLPLLAAMIAESKGLAQLVAAQLRKRKDTYTVTEAAQKLGVCPKTIRNRIAAKTLPVVEGIGAIRIPAPVIDRLVDPKLG